MRGFSKNRVIFLVILLILIVLLVFYVLSRPGIVILSPNGGEVWETEETYEIKWFERGMSQEKIAVWLGGYDSEGNPIPKAYRLANDISASQESYLWEISPVVLGYFQETPEKYKIRITEPGEPVLFDESDNYFIINQ